MTHEPSTKLETRLFVGCFLTSEIRMHLHKSIQWKHATIMADGLQIVHYHGKDYLGIYLDVKKLSLSELADFQQNIRNQLHHYCPSLETGKIEISIFSQVFLA